VKLSDATDMGWHAQQLEDSKRWSRFTEVGTETPVQTMCLGCLQTGAGQPRHWRWTRWSRSHMTMAQCLIGQLFWKSAIVVVACRQEKTSSGTEGGYTGQDPTCMGHDSFAGEACWCNWYGLTCSKPLSWLLADRSRPDQALDVDLQGKTAYCHFHGLW